MKFISCPADAKEALSGILQYESADEDERGDDGVSPQASRERPELPHVSIAPRLSATDDSMSYEGTGPGEITTVSNARFNSFGAAASYSGEQVLGDNCCGDLRGLVEKCHVGVTAFELERREFNKYGVTTNPSDASFGRPAQVYASKSSLNPTVQFGSHENKKKRRKAASGPYVGPWIAPEDDARKAILESEAARNAAKYEASSKQNRRNLSEGDGAPETTDGSSSATTIFHGNSETDYQGRSWITPHPSIRPPDEDATCAIPKKLLHTFVGHTMGVHAIRFFPKFGHLLLSASMDGKCKIWSTLNDRRCIRTYVGHTGGVRDANFTPDGHQFYTCSFDKVIRLWDTETGKSIQTFGNNKIPYCVSVHPKDGTSIICGCQNKMAVQYDSRTGLVVQEYAEHLGAVNSVTFLEDGQRIATTADDKKLFLWEYGMGVVIKHIAEAHMQSMPAVKLSPDQRHIACQSMDNQIVIYEAKGRYRLQSKRFRGHQSAGYAILPGFSWDNRFLVSGDSTGKLWFWDWKTTKNQRTLQAHSQVCTGTEWHPTSPNRVATCSWDGTIKLWG